MKILHTADIHLKEHGDERWQALAALLELAVREQAGLLAVSGDLFDRGTDLLRLQDRVRETLTGLPFRVLILPGNHDHAAYSAGIYLGDSAQVLDDWRRPVELGDTWVWGLPFEKAGGVEILNRLRTIAGRMSAAADRRHLLLYHGELLDAFFSRHEMGEEGADRYMPVKLSYFAGLPCDCILAGHFHAGYRAWTLPREDGRESWFVYPGSPVSVTRRETGRRKVNLVEPGRPPRELPLDTFHYEEKTVNLDPFGTNAPLDQVGRALDGLHPAARLLLAVTGYINSAAGVDESTLAGEVEKLVSGLDADRPVFTFRDISLILEDNLFRDFLARLEQSGAGPAELERRREMALRAMMEVGQC